MYPHIYLLPMKTFSNRYRENYLVKFVRKAIYLWVQEKIKYLIQKELNQIVNHKVVQPVMQ